MGKNTWSVYQHVFPDGKKYIGCTGEAPEKRWKYGSGYAGQPEVYQAVIKYGWNHIKHEIVKDELSESEAKTLERQLIEREEPRMLYNSELFSNGRHFSEKKDKGDYFVGAGTSVYEVELFMTDKEYVDMWNKIGMKFVNLRFESEKVVAWYCKIEDETYSYVELEAMYPDSGVRYRDFGHWVSTDAVFNESVRMETKMDAEEAKRLFALN